MMKLENIEALIDSDGQVSLGYMRPIDCVAVASDESNALVMLRRHPGESLTALLKRLDQAIERAVEYGEYPDEVNEPRGFSQISGLQSMDAYNS